jgi:protein-S-isoprenylcysteine O-methyltransferase Ste14
MSWGGGLLFVVSLAYYLYAYLVRFGVPPSPGPVARPVLADFALFSAFALHHSLFARMGLKGWVRRIAPPELERSLYTWISSILFLVVCLAWVPVPGVLYQFAGWASVPGYAAQLAALALTFRASRALDVLDLAGVRPVQNARHGRRPSHVPLETRGVYALVRHPIYFAWALFVFAAPAMTATRLAFAAISTLYLAIAVPLEERSLVKEFGDEYRAYRAKVRWRMLPGIY